MEITRTSHPRFDELTAPDGLFITQAADVAPAERIFATRLSCPPGGADADWRTATAQEKEAFEAVSHEPLPEAETSQADTPETPAQP